MSQQQFCFCTLALGKVYRGLASLLAKDLELYSPNTAFIVLTDNPQEFSKYSQVLAFQHQQQGVKCYHDKRFAIAKALSLFNSCIFIDSDMRILAPVPEYIEWLLEPGISARACMDMPKKFAKALTKTDKYFSREIEVIKKAAQFLNLDPECENVTFVHEYLFSVTKSAGKEIEFLETWEILAKYFELNGVYEGEGNAIGLAAYKAGLPVRWSEMSGISFFNNKTELIKIQKGQSNMDEMLTYFQEHGKLAHPKRSILEKIVFKLSKAIMHVYRAIKYKVVTSL
ncbi:hypothetical protein PQG02_19890 [Nostoc sp. UHCC 0926]|uniref:hypothetical protein n=1 Tax=unclassified Nostoc TaxID=2593658 RepID=UPI00236002D1|nr:hypothetical protein [Nostoc sp. UHCC 0926]WDD30991.1 hypothetical protein PQG02_19890 [Nostoc sp. UHCC 0926]